MATTLEPTVRLLLTLREAAHSLGVSERHLWAHTQPRGDIPAVKWGRAVRYDPEDLKRWIDSKK